eukprot:Rmarinus@m.14236
MQVDDLSTAFSQELKILTSFIYQMFTELKRLVSYEPVLTQLEKERILYFCQRKLNHPGCRSNRTLPQDLEQQFAKKMESLRGSQLREREIESQIFASLEDWVKVLPRNPKPITTFPHFDLSKVKLLHAAITDSLAVLRERAEQVEEATQSSTTLGTGAKSTEELFAEREALKTQLARKDAALEDLLDKVHMIKDTLPNQP